MRPNLLLVAALLCCIQQIYPAPLLANHAAGISPREQQHRHGAILDPTPPNNSHALASVLQPPPRRDSPPFLTGVVLVTAANILFNALRPDPSISFESRVPRILWEFFLLCSAINLKASPDSAYSYMLLAIMLGTTALIDIFIWAPLFGLWASFGKKECSGGWFTGKPKVCKTNPVKGYGRLLVTFQSLYAGAFYLHCAIACWGEYSDARDRVKAERQARLFEHYMHSSGRK